MNMNTMLEKMKFGKPMISKKIFAGESKIGIKAYIQYGHNRYGVYKITYLQDEWGKKNKKEGQENKKAEAILALKNFCFQNQYILNDIFQESAREVI